jgi:hypothetical protein
MPRTTCATCGDPLVQPGGAGRPPTYCSMRCNRKAEHVRLLERVLAQPPPSDDELVARLNAQG